MKFRIVFSFVAALVSLISFGQNCEQSVLSKKLVSQRDSSADYVLIFQNPFHDSLVFVVIPNDGELLAEKSLNFSLTSDSTVSVSRDWRGATHILNFISLNPGESFLIDLKVEGAFDLSLGYKYFLISEKDYLANQNAKTRRKDRYRKEMDFITSHKFCEEKFEIVR